MPDRISASSASTMPRYFIRALSSRLGFHMRPSTYVWVNCIRSTYHVWIMMKRDQAGDRINAASMFRDFASGEVSRDGGTDAIAHTKATRTRNLHAGSDGQGYIGDGVGASGHSARNSD